MSIVDYNGDMEIESSKTPYREKTALLYLFAMAVTFGPYFVIVSTRTFPNEAWPDMRQLGLFAVVTLTQLLILGIGHLILRRGSPLEAGMPPDERDSAIMRRSINSAYYVLIAGMILVGCIMPFNSRGWEIVNTAVFVIVLAEIVHNGMIVVSYRSQR